MNKKVDGLGCIALKNMFKDDNRKGDVSDRLQASINSFLGVLSHYKTYNIRRNLINRNLSLLAYGYFSHDRLCFRSYR